MQRTFVHLGNVVVRTDTVVRMQEGVVDGEKVVFIIHGNNSTTIAKGITFDKAVEMINWASDDARSL